MRIGSPPDDTIPSSPGRVSGKTATSASGQPSDEGNDGDGVMRLKMASGLMGCLRGLEKGSPESPLNRAGKMLQAALDSRSPTTPRTKPRNKRASQSSSEISSSPESPYGKRYRQSPNEGPRDKKNKQKRIWSLAGDIHDEVALFLEEIDFTKIDLQKFTFGDLRSQMETQRGCSLTKAEKRVFLQMTKAAIKKSVPPASDSDDQEEVVELSATKCEVSPPVEKKETKPDITNKRTKESVKTPTCYSKEKSPASVKQSPPPLSTTTASTPENKNGRKKNSSVVLDDEIFKLDTPSASSSIPVDDDSDDIPSMLYSSQDNITERQEFCFGEGHQSLPIKNTSSDSMVECPICSKFFPTAEVEFHAALCVNETDPTPSVAEPEVDLMPCPICSRLFPLAQIEQHADECVETSMSEGSNNLEREVLTI